MIRAYPTLDDPVKSVALPLRYSGIFYQGSLLSDKRILSLHHKISCCVSLYFLCIYYTKKFLENQLYQTKKDRKNPYWNLNKTYFICADYNESPYTTDLLFIYHRFGSSINMDFPLIFTFCFSSPDRRFGAHALFSSYKILSSLSIKKVDESSINYRYPKSPTHFAVGAPILIYSHEDGTAKWK